MKIEEYLKEHPTLTEDLRIAADLLKKKRPIIAAALLDLEDNLKNEYETYFL